MKKDKSLSNDGSIKEFSETFWDELKENFIDSIIEVKEKQNLSTSQRLTIINLIEKKVEI